MARDSQTDPIDCGDTNTLGPNKVGASSAMDFFTQHTKFFSTSLIAKALLVIAIVLGAPYLLNLLLDRDGFEEEVSNLSERPLEIRELVRQVKQELEALDKERIEKNEMPLFELDYFDLELHFIVANQMSADIEGGPQFLVVSNSTQVSAERVQRITIRMKASGSVSTTKEAQTFPPNELGDAIPLSSPPLKEDADEN